MKYAYRIAGRTPGVIDQELYQGDVEADTPKEAMIKALAAQFGDQDKTDPIAALTDTGWIDRELLDDNLCIVDDQDRFMELQAEEHSYAVEVTPH